MGVKFRRIAKPNTFKNKKKKKKHTHSENGEEEHTS